MIADAVLDGLWLPPGFWGISRCDSMCDMPWAIRAWRLRPFSGGVVSYALTSPSGGRAKAPMAADMVRDGLVLNNFNINVVCVFPESEPVV